MLLYHFTKSALWEQILSDGRLDPGRAIWEDAPKVLHLSTSPDLGALPRDLWNRDLRITVEVDRGSVSPWRAWSEHLPSNLAVMVANLSDCKLHAGDSRAWWISEVPIPSGQWTRAERCAWTQLWPHPTES